MTKTFEIVPVNQAGHNTAAVIETHVAGKARSVTEVMPVQKARRLAVLMAGGGRVVDHTTGAFA